MRRRLRRSACCCACCLWDTALCFLDLLPALWLFLYPWHVRSHSQPATRFPRPESHRGFLFFPNSSYLLHTSSPLTFSGVKVTPCYLSISTPVFLPTLSNLPVLSRGQESVSNKYNCDVPVPPCTGVGCSGPVTGLLQPPWDERASGRDEEQRRTRELSHPSCPPPTWTLNPAALQLSLILIFVVLLSENTSGFQDQVQGLTKTREALYE